MEYRLKRSKYGQWVVVRPIGSGGQGTVYLAEKDIILGIKGILVQLTGLSDRDEGELERDLIGKLRESDCIEGALKVLHESEDYSKAISRMKREIEGLQRIRHENVATMLDYDIEARWFVSRYYKNGPLSQHLDMFKGKPLAALKAFRSLVDGVAAIHANGLIHRDIKTENIFIDNYGKLILVAV